MIAPLFLSLVVLVALPCGAGFSLGKKQQEKKLHVRGTHAKSKKGLFNFKDKKRAFIRQMFVGRGPFTEANQGVLRQNPFQDLVKTCKLYNQFTTLATFDAVQLDENIVRLLVDKKKEVRCLTQAEADGELDQQLSELAQKHVFYVLADVRADRYEKLTDKKAEWRLGLKEQPSDQPAAPQKITETELDAETRLLFGEDWREASAFKTVYKFEFPRSAVQPHERACALVVSSNLVSDELVWPVHSSAA